VIEGLLGRKIGMVQFFDKEGRLRGATVIEAGPCLVSQIKTEDTDGYQAVQLAYGTRKRTNKPQRGHLKQLGDMRYLREFRTDDPTQHKLGDRLGVEIFQEGDEVDITGTSKGRGFAGVVKRYRFAGGPKTHGQSDRHRAGGSIGAGNTPGRVFRGQRMGGHMGDERVTVKNLEVLQSNAARGILLVAGSVPGARNSLLIIRYSSQTLPLVRDRKPKEEEKPVPDEEQETPAAEAGAPDADKKAGDSAAEQSNKEKSE